jgi:hypothetical protein
LAYAGYKIRSPSETWESNGGTEAEKALLLAAMLRGQGIQAEPVAVLAERFYNKRTVTPALFERFLVKILIQGMEPIYLSPAQTDNQDQRCWLAGKRIITLKPGKEQPSEVIAAIPNIYSLTGKMQLDDSLDLKGTLSLELGGRLNSWLKIKKDKASAKSVIASSLSNAEISELKEGRSEMALSSYTFNFASTTSTSKKAGHVILKLPSAANASDNWHMTELISTRIEPLEIPFPINESYDLFISLPEGYSMISPPVDITTQNEFGKLRVSISAENGQLHIVRSLELQKTLVETSAYGTFRSMMNDWNNRKCREVVVGK